MAIRGDWAGWRPNASALWNFARCGQEENSRPVLDMGEQERRSRLSRDRLRAVVLTELLLRCKSGGWPSLFPRAGGPAFEFPRNSNDGGAPFFAGFAKGGNHEVGARRSYAARSANEIFVHPSFTRTDPISPSK